MMDYRENAGYAELMAQKRQPIPATGRPVMR